MNKRKQNCLLLLLFCVFMFCKYERLCFASEMENNEWKTQGIKPEIGEIDASNFSIGGITMASSNMRDVLLKFGDAEIVRKVEQGPLFICYILSGKTDFHAFAFFESSFGCVGLDRYVRSVWIGNIKYRQPEELNCSISTIEMATLATDSGIKLGITKEKIISIIGRPTHKKGNRLIYYYDRKQKYNSSDLKIIEEKGKETFGEKYIPNPYYYITTRIEAFFEQNKLVWFFIEKSEAT